MRVMTHMPTRKKKKKRGSSSSSVNNALSTTSTTTTPTTTTRTMRLEKMAIGALLMIAWGWIMVTLGMVFYHGYYNHNRNRNEGFHQHAHGGRFGGGAGGHNMMNHGISFPGQRTASSAMKQLQNLRLGRQQQEEQQQQHHHPNPPAIQAGGPVQPHESPILIFTCHREEYLNQTLSDIYRYIPRDCSMGCPIIVSQDGTHAKVAQVIIDFQKKFQAIGIPLVHLQHTSSLRGGNTVGAAAYKALAVHYGWALQQVFENKAVVVTSSSNNVEPKRVIILEEDLHVAVDFFDYFKALAPLLDRDTSLLAISAYNDNGFDHAVQDVERVVRSDFFPGLGWMMTRKLWTNELQRKWPPAYWDDWLREPAQQQGRHILRPEVSRTYHFGVDGGASRNQFGNQLSKVLLNPTPVKWSAQDLSYLAPEHFDRQYWQMLHSSRRVTSLTEAKELIAQHQQQQQQQAAGRTLAVPQLVLRLEYNNLHDFAKLARSLGLSEDEKAGVPRTAYKGVVETRFGATISASDNKKSSNSSKSKHLLLLTPPMQDLQKDFEDVI